MKLFVKLLEKPSLYHLMFYNDGSFGPKPSIPPLDYEINLSRNGSIELLASRGTGICYCFEGYSWKEFHKFRHTEINISSEKEGRLCFEFEDGDPCEWGTEYNTVFNLTCVDLKQKLVLYGLFPKEAVVVRFAIGQYVCVSKEEIVGLIIDFSDAF